MSKNIATDKRNQIDKANRRVLIIMIVAAFVTTFSLVSSKALLVQRNYQSKVISEKTVAAKTLKSNLTAANTLAESYKTFVSSSTNVLEGSNVGQGDNDGDNAKIVLNSLPSKYDFPALVSSLDKILSGKTFKVNGITGIDDELAQSTASSPAPVPLEIPIQLSITGPYVSAQNFLEILDRSIRPFQITQITLSGSSDSVNVTLSAKTFYQPEKNLKITSKEVK